MRSDDGIPSGCADHLWKWQQSCNVPLDTLHGSNSVSPSRPPLDDIVFCALRGRTCRRNLGHSQCTFFSSAFASLMMTSLKNHQLETGEKLKRSLTKMENSGRGRLVRLPVQQTIDNLCKLDHGWNNSFGAPEKTTFCWRKKRHLQRNLERKLFKQSWPPLVRRKPLANAASNDHSGLRKHRKKCEITQANFKKKETRITVRVIYVSFHRIL